MGRRKKPQPLVPGGPAIPGSGSGYGNGGARGVTGKRSVGRPPTRWTDDTKRVAGSRWIQAAQNRGTWNSLQKTYVQQWTSIG
ncbi:jg11669 [Pararge aegeria aegeria]|uniref:Jg11669 protein n=1 Tax=Pararge aegeria aegeria TaxID=348720 RepID=A0A8S4RZH2_9NEOP|nr:jg11669 [Pararge aegeria aegeria]